MTTIGPTISVRERIKAAADALLARWQREYPDVDPAYYGAVFPGDGSGIDDGPPYDAVPEDTRPAWVQADLDGWEPLRPGPLEWPPRGIEPVRLDNGQPLAKWTLGGDRK